MKSLLQAIAETVYQITGLVFVGLVIAYFPYAVDDPTVATDSALRSEAEAYYDEIYQPTPEIQSDGTDNHEYVQLGRASGDHFGVVDLIKQFVDRYDLAEARVLEVGAGSGQLQDVVGDYTGLDIAASAARYFHKPFVVGSATALPFADNEFDVVWTIWTLEHVPNPGLALSEMRRVVKPGGYLFLAPAWHSAPWFADGYEVRPYSDFGFSGKIAKGALPFRRFAARPGTLAGRRARRLIFDASRPTRFRYTRLDADFEDYWVPDIDAVNSLDPHEVMLWYVSRGDECLTCPSGIIDQLKMNGGALIIRVGEKVAGNSSANQGIEGANLD